MARKGEIQRARKPAHTLLRNFSAHAGKAVGGAEGSEDDPAAEPPSSPNKRLDLFLSELALKKPAHLHFIQGPSASINPFAHIREK